MNTPVQLDLFADMPVEVDTPFTNRVVCLTGKFRQSSHLLQQKFRDMGADYKPSARITRNTHFLLVGENPSTEQMEYLRGLNFNGYYPHLLYQSDLDAILQGHYDGYREPADISKKLHLTEEHYLKFKLDFDKGQNPLYTHEIYVAPDTLTESSTLFQMMGNKGIYANTYMDDSTDAIVISDDTLKRLQAGEEDNVLQYIEANYNKSRSQSYRYVMTTESEFLSFLQK